MSRVGGLGTSTSKLCTCSHIRHAVGTGAKNFRFSTARPASTASSGTERVCVTTGLMENRASGRLGLHVPKRHAVVVEELLLDKVMVHGDGLEVALKPHRTLVTVGVSMHLRITFGAQQRAQRGSETDTRTATNTCWLCAALATHRMKGRRLLADEKPLKVWCRFRPVSLHRLLPLLPQGRWRCRIGRLCRSATTME